MVDGGPLRVPAAVAVLGLPPVGAGGGGVPAAPPDRLHRPFQRRPLLLPLVLRGPAPHRRPPAQPLPRTRGGAAGHRVRQARPPARQLRGGARQLLHQPRVRGRQDAGDRPGRGRSGGGSPGGGGREPPVLHRRALRLAAVPAAAAAGHPADPGPHQRPGVPADHPAAQPGGGAHADAGPVGGGRLRGPGAVPALRHLRLLDPHGLVGLRRLRQRGAARARARRPPARGPGMHGGGGPAHGPAAPVAGGQRGGGGPGRGLPRGGRLDGRTRLPGGPPRRPRAPRAPGLPEPRRGLDASGLGHGLRARGRVTGAAS